MSGGSCAARMSEMFSSGSNILRALATLWSTTASAASSKTSARRYAAPVAELPVLSEIMFCSAWMTCSVFPLTSRSATLSPLARRALAALVTRCFEFMRLTVALPLGVRARREPPEALPMRWLLWLRATLRFMPFMASAPATGGAGLPW